MIAITPEKMIPLIDIHTHILPEMDDGSRSVKESISMLDSLEKQNVALAVMTPHFYARREDPERFLRRREKSYGHLMSAYGGNVKTVLGAEVEYYSGITATSELPLLRIGNSKLLLLEMPFMKWSGRVIDDVLELNSRSDLRIAIAHIERYCGYQSAEVLDVLAGEGVLMQANASFFEGFFSSRKAFGMLLQDRIHLLGSDSHNMTDRSPNMKNASDKIEKKLGRKAVLEISRRSAAVLGALV